MLVRMWGKHTRPLMVGVQTCAVTIETSVAIPTEVGNLPTSLLGRYPRTLHPPAETLVHPCSLLLYIHPEIGNNLAVHQQKKGSGNVARAHNRILLRC